MAKIKASDITLSFKKDNRGKGGTWCKKYKDPSDGKWKVKYFCKGKGRSDRASERKAKAMYIVWKEELDLVTTMARVINRVKAATANGGGGVDAFGDTLAEQMVKAMLGTPEVAEPTPVHQLPVDEFDAHFEEPDSLADLAAKQLLYSRASANRKAAGKKGKPTVAQLAEQWLQSEELKVKTKQLTATAHRDKTNGIKQFSDHANGDYFNGNVEDMLMSYRAKLLTKMAAGEYSGNTVNDKLKFARQFINWCFENRKLDEQPRCMSSFSKRVEVKKGGEPVDLPDVHKLWAAANDRQKCFIAIALNTGMKTGDITALKGKQLKGNRLSGYRPKTAVPFNVKLWPLTVELIEKCRDTHGDDEYIFTNNDGGRITTDSFGQVYKKLASKAGVNQKKNKSKKGEPLPSVFSQLRDTSVDLIDKKLLNIGYDMALKQVFEQHGDHTTSQYYNNRVPENMQIDKLDELTDYLGEVYGLKL